MMKTIVELGVQTLGPVLYVLLLLGAVLGLFVGAMLLFDSERVMRWNYALNTWYSTRKAMRKLEQPVDIKRAVYRWHRILGVALVGGSLFTLDVLVFDFPANTLARAFRDLGNPALLGLVFETLRIALIVGNVAALLAAVVLVFRPSLLKGVEAWGDRQYSARASTKPLEIMRYGPDDFVRARPRLVGGLLVLGSAYVLVVLGLALL
jgi:hypothetical protein